VFEVGDYAYLKVTPMKKKRFGVRSKACHQICGTVQDLGKERSSSLEVGIT
jgi:hypothetical protein